MGISVKPKVRIRWSVRADLDRIVEIERASFIYPWGESEILAALRSNRNVCMVAEVDGVVAGFMFYGMEPTYIEIISIAVHPDFRNRGVATQMIDRIKSKLANRRTYLIADTYEGNLVGHLFFQSSGFVCTNIVVGAEDLPDASFYRFKWFGDEHPRIKIGGRNRITEYMEGQSNG